MHAGEKRHQVYVWLVLTNSMVNRENIKGNPDIPVFRLAEAYYMLAECKLRAGDKAAAASLINTVRERYFPEGDRIL